MPVSLRRDRVCRYVHATASADGYADESYTLAASGAPDGAYAMHAGTPSVAAALVAQQVEARVDRVFACAPSVPVVTGDVLMTLPTGALYRVTGVTDARRLRSRLVAAVFAEDAVYRTLGVLPGGG